MSTIPFRELQRQLMDLYNKKEYTMVLARSEQELANFPEQRDAILYWCMCMQVVLANTNEALQTLRQALEEGFWYSPKWLKEDPDLATLQELPEFQKLAEMSRQRLAKAQLSTLPQLFVEQPAGATTTRPLLIGLHGNGSNAKDTLEQWSGLTEQGWLVAVPQSSQIVSSSGYVWDNREQAIDEIRAHLATMQRDYKADPQRVVLGGFSMGGGQAIWMALQQSIQTCGFVVLGPYLTPDELEALPALLETQKPAGVRGSILIGEDDVPCLEVSHKVEEIMRAAGLSCELKLLPGLDHSYPPDFRELVVQGLSFVEQV